MFYTGRATALGQSSRTGDRGTGLCTGPGRQIFVFRVANSADDKIVRSYSRLKNGVGCYILLPFRKDVIASCCFWLDQIGLSSYAGLFRSETMQGIRIYFHFARLQRLTRSRRGHIGRETRLDSPEPEKAKNIDRYPWHSAVGARAIRADHLRYHFDSLFHTRDCRGSQVINNRFKTRTIISLYNYCIDLK